MSLQLDKNRDLSKPLEKFFFRVDKGFTSARLDRYLQEQLPWRSRTSIQKLIQGGRVLRRLPGREEAPVLRPAARLIRGETLTLLVHAKSQPPIIRMPIQKLDIVYEDSHMLAVNKPPFLIHGEVQNFVFLLCLRCLA